MAVTDLIKFDTCPMCDVKLQDKGLTVDAGAWFQKVVTCAEHGLLTIYYYIETGSLAYREGARWNG